MMAAATLPISRSMRIPLSQRQDINDFGFTDSEGVPDEWGPSSIPPTSSNNIPWDDQVVPALRKKLEAESRDISKRISRIQESENGWARSRESIDSRADPRAVFVGEDQSKRMSREVVQHHLESSVDQYHNRFATVRTPSTPKREPFDSPNQRDKRVVGSVLATDATQRAREKARQIAARQKAQQLQQKQQQQQGNGSKDSTLASSDMHGYYSRTDGSFNVIPEIGVAVAANNGSSIQNKRLRTQSTPMRPSLDAVGPPDPLPSRRTHNQSSADPIRPVANGHQRTSSLSRRKAAATAAMDAKLVEEFGPLGHTPSPTAKLLRAHQELDPSSRVSTSSPSVRNRTIQPDAFRSLSPPGKSARYTRESSAPPSFGGSPGDVSEFGGSPGSKSMNSWEDQIIPTVARKLQQEQFLQAGKEGRLSRYEGLIDTWDKNGLPLSRSDVMAIQRQREKKMQEEGQHSQQEQMQDQDRGLKQDEVEEEQVLTPGPAQALQQTGSQLSPVDADLGRSRSGASSKSSAGSQHSQPYQQQKDYQQKAAQHMMQQHPMHQHEQQRQQLQQQHQQVESVPMQEFHSQPSRQPPQNVYQTTSKPAVSTQPQPGVSGGHKDDVVEKGGCCCIVM